MLVLCLVFLLYEQEMLLMNLGNREVLHEYLNLEKGDSLVIRAIRIISLA